MRVKLAVWYDIANDLFVETHAQYDNFGNLRKAWDANGNLTQTGYSSTYAYAYPTSVTTAVPDSTGTHGSSTAFTTTATFDTVTGLPLTTTDANGLKTEITYDTVTLRPLNTKMYYGGVQVGGTSETVYHDEPGNFWVKNRSQIDETNWAESITYFDGLGRAWKTEKADSNGNIFVEKEFDAEGRVKRVSNPFRSGEAKQWTTNVYDEASRVVEVVLPDGATIETDYGISTSGVVGITKQITDQAGKKRRGITDAQGRMVRVIEDPDGQNLNTDYVFDTLGNLRKTIQGEQSRYFMHDSLGRLLYAKQPEQEANTGFTATDPITGNTAWSVKYEYDNNGNITKTTDAEGVYIQGTYDALNRITVRDYSDSTPDVGFYYDGKYLDASDTPQTATGSVKGKTTGVRSAVSRTNYPSFDVFGRPLSHRQITDGETYSTAYAYNLSGALIEETYPSGRVVRNDLDADGGLSRVYGNAVSQTEQTYANSFNYDVNGAVTAMRLGNGRWETAQYNNRQQITQIGLGGGAGDTSLLKLEYGYGTSSQNNGSLREQTISFDGLADPFEQTYTYDDLNRLQVAEEKVDGTTTWKQTFEIDRYGNRRFDTSTSGLTTTLGSCTEAVCNPEISTATNRLTTSGYAYDKNGNLIQDAEGKQFVYDAENHQIEVKNDQSVTIGEYLYDGDGRRVKKITDTETTVFVYDAGGQLVAEYSTQTAQDPKISYLTTDHLGSPRVITNENGAVIDRKDYTAFGEESFSAERTSGLGYAVADEVRKGYTGYEKDNESGLDFAQARYYNSTHGRYTSVDPLTASASIRNPQTFNRYSYVLNSPYKFTDPLGLLPNGSTDPCDFRCRVMNAIQHNGTLSKSDFYLAVFHAQNGTALGNAFLNASYAALQSGVVPNAASQPVNIGMKMSADGRKMLAEEGMEGYRKSPYDNDGGGNCTVGVGHKLKDGKCDRKNTNHTRQYSSEEIERLYDDDLRDAELIVIKTVNVRLKQHEFDALVMLAFNYPKLGRGGAPNLEEALNEGRTTISGGDPSGSLYASITLWKKNSAIKREWEDINKVNGKVNAGLVHRRSYETRLFFSGKYFSAGEK